MIVNLPIKTGTGQNDRMHWRALANRAKAHREAAFLSVKSGLQKIKLWDDMPVLSIAFDWEVTLTRISAGTLDAHDNLRASLKHVVDGVADALGLKDNDPRITWKYAQEKCKRGYFGVRIQIEPEA